MVRTGLTESATISSGIRATRPSRFGGVTLRFFCEERGLTVIEMLVTLTMSSIILLAIVQAFSHTLRLNRQSDEVLVNQQVVMVIGQNIRADVLRADPIVPDPSNPAGPSDHFDFGLPRIDIVGGSFVRTRDYYRYALHQGSVVKLPAEYDETLGRIVPSGQEPVWRYGENVSRLKFEYEIDPSSGAVVLVKISITAGEGDQAYSQTIVVAPRNAI